MAALFVILSCVTVLAGVFTVVIRQMADAHRQHYRDEMAANNLAYARQREIDEKASRKVRLLRGIATSRKPTSRLPSDHPHSVLMR
ncbi:hypothetical protein ABK249_26460 [Neorhizobium sp. Rsf11]|uniref:Uncharacterized protein n=1 Tax=Neorhizobium phenanthreniclasticum TaxID=3157917 RepID=A0ABV0M9X2_9HYPH